MAQLKPGTVATLTVAREAPFGFFLTDGSEDVLLHNHDMKESLNVNDKPTVFLYQDHKGRLAATMQIPAIQLGRYGWADVVEVNKRYGVFVNIGINKDILLSKDDLPDEWIDWPAAGDRVYCSLKLDKHGRLFAKLADESIMNVLSIPAPKDIFNRDVTATIYRLLIVGAHAITEEGYIGFIHESESPDRLRLGQVVHARVIAVKEGGTMNLSLRARAYEAIDETSEMILRYMESRDGAMPYWDKSLPDDIKKRFGISKAAFKRALGKLMKEGKVYQDEGWTYFKGEK
ncbi:S1-like domain-containing RNA-binding protein [Terrilactibacillus sp. S3-3]|nr:S1-like domain-containing RNA-binding protein [Terrilactibacillus sp. S3-3]